MTFTYKTKNDTKRNWMFGNETFLDLIRIHPTPAVLRQAVHPYNNFNCFLLILSLYLRFNRDTI